MTASQGGPSAGPPGGPFSGPFQRLRQIRVSSETHRVTTFELLFDLVFVFAFTQVTEFMSHAHSAQGVLEAMIILGLLWWSWASYSWLANQTHVDEGIVRIGMALAMAAMFVVALTIPEAFEDLEGGLSGPLVLVAAYCTVRIIHALLYLAAAGEDRVLRQQVLLGTLPLLVGAAFLLAGALVGGNAQLWLWLAGLTADIVLTYVTASRGGWRIQSAAHWAERYGLVIILALGESIVAIGVGAAQIPIDGPILAGALLAILLSLSLWLIYFDAAALAGEETLKERTGMARAALASDAYTYLHLALTAGVLISALGVEEAMAHVEAGDPLGLFGAAALGGGTSLYLAAHGAFVRRVGTRWPFWRMAMATALLAGVPLMAALPSLAALGLALVPCLVVVAVETLSVAREEPHVLADESAGEAPA